MPPAQKQAAIFDDYMQTRSVRQRAEQQQQNDLVSCYTMPCLAK